MTDTLTPMQREVLSRTDDIFASIATTAGQVVDFGKEQLPDIAYQFITYNRVYLTAIMLFGIVLIVVQQVLSIRLYNNANEHSKFDFGAAYIFATTITLMISSIIVATNFSKFVMVWAAPKLFLIIEVTKMIKG